MRAKKGDDNRSIGLRACTQTANSLPTLHHSALGFCKLELDHTRPAMASPRQDGHGPHDGAPTYAGMAELVPALPLETRCLPFALRRYGGFWLPEPALRRGLPALHAGFAPRRADVLLASYPKSGTTWLKALAFATVRRAAHPPSSIDHPLRRRNPQDCVPFIEFHDGDMAELDALPSPRVLATHLPYSLLPDRVVADDGARIVYVCRDPKDALVSSWLFTRKASPSIGVDSDSYSLQEAAKLFREGRCFYGPQCRHVLQYWEASRRPCGGGEVLFLRYEEMLRDPAGSLKTMAEFMGCGFSEEEVARGVVDEIVDLCSLEKLKNMEANRDGRRNASGIRSDSFFRKGVAGDWSSHMSPEMGKMLDEATEDALRGSGFSFSG
ncbi:hypothetical protein CFC21_073196 [Triticum aestivum]|uniref:Sulfotransferase n=3 Tax=Triticum aestivum TaxID=4565 RepID=A0A9R1HKR3_WHEAT|nr:hypothetical protein CFC21_073196 [Triticum aestivum]